VFQLERNPHPSGSKQQHVSQWGGYDTDNVLVTLGGRNYDCACSIQVKRLQPNGGYRCVRESYFLITDAEGC